MRHIFRVVIEMRGSQREEIVGRVRGVMIEVGKAIGSATIALEGRMLDLIMLETVVIEVVGVASPHSLLGALTLLGDKEACSGTEGGVTILEKGGGGEVTTTTQIVQLKMTEMTSIGLNGAEVSVEKAGAAGVQGHTGAAENATVAATAGAGVVTEEVTVDVVVTAEAGAAVEVGGVTAKEGAAVVAGA